MISEACKYSNLKIAVVVEVFFVEEEGGDVRRLRLDFSSECYTSNNFLVAETFPHRGSLLQGPV